MCGSEGVDVFTGVESGDCAVAGCGDELADVLGAAVARGEDAFAGSGACFVGDDIADLVKLDEIFKRLVVGQLTDAYESALAVDSHGLVSFGVFKAQRIELVFADKLLEGEVISYRYILAGVQQVYKCLICK